jgi:hypothetical protein
VALLCFGLRGVSGMTATPMEAGPRGGAQSDPDICYREESMPNRRQIERDLCSLLSKPEYSALFFRMNQFRGSTDRNGKIIPRFTPLTVAQQAAERISGVNAMLDPVDVTELHGPVEIYRAHDGRSSRWPDGKDWHLSAGTLGSYWFERDVASAIGDAARRQAEAALSKRAGDRSGAPETSGAETSFRAEFEKQYFDFLRSAHFVLPEWNKMTKIAVLFVPVGVSVVVVRGRGNWKAMRTPSGQTRPTGPGTEIQRKGDVIDHLGTMPIPGVRQTYVPLVDDMKVSELSPKAATWPLFS